MRPRSTAAAAGVFVSDWGMTLSPSVTYEEKR
jgi:hypothetical protein